MFRSGSPESRRKRKRSARARIGFRGSYDRGAGIWRRMTRLPNAAVLFSLFMMAAVCVRKMVMSASRARTAELKAKARASRSPLAILLEEQHQIHYQAAALSDPVNKCLSHTNGGHKQPVTLGVFTCVADARFLLRAMIVIRKRTKGLGQLLVLDVGSPPASDAGGITAGRGWDLRKTKSTQVNRRVKFREEPLPESSSLVLIESHKEMSADDWIDVVLSVLQLLTPEGSIVLMEQRQIAIPYRDTDDQDDSRPGTTNMTGPGSPVLREAITYLACGEAGLAVAVAAFDEGLAVVRRPREDQTRLERGCFLVDDGEPHDRENHYTSVSSATSTASADTDSSSPATGAAAAAAGTASPARRAASATMSAGSATANTASPATETEASATGTEASATGTEASATSTEATATGTEATATSTEATVTGTEATAANTVAPAPSLPLLRFEEMFAFAMGKTWTPEVIHTKFGGAESVRKYAHRAGSRLFCVKNLARDSEGTGPKKTSTGKLRNSKPEKDARVCLENHLKKHPQDVRGAYVLEMVLQAGGGVDSVDVDKEVARLRETATTERGEAGLSLWKALHARSAGAEAVGQLLP